MLRRSWSGAIAFCVLPTLCTTSTLRAAGPQREAVFVDYAAEGQCPERSWLLSEIEARAEGLQLAERDAHARRFVLRIDRRGQVYVGRLDIHSPSGEVAEDSEIRGPDCDDVALGLTVASALALDPRASASSTPPAEEASKAPAAEPSPVAPHPNESPIASRTSAPEVSRGLSGPHFGLGARVEASRGVADVLGGAALFGELAWSSPLRWFAPKARLGARQTLPASIDVLGGHVDMSLSAAFAELCPVALRLGGSIEVGACLQGSVGALSASAKGVPGARDEQRLWLDYGGLGTVRWWYDAHVSLEASLGLSVPITRHRIRVASDVVSRADALVMGAGAGALYRF